MRRAAEYNATIEFDEVAQTPHFTYYKTVTVPRSEGSEGDTDSNNNGIGNGVGNSNININSNSDIDRDDVGVVNGVSDANANSNANVNTEEITYEQHEVWFEDERSYNAKMQVVKEFGLAGISIWNLMSYTPVLLESVAENFVIAKVF